MMDVTQYVDAQNGYLHGEIFTNPEIYEQELQQVFSRSWVFLAHDSMLPKAGDFIQNYIGEDPVIVARQKDGSVAAFLNQCRHRGMRLARVDRGNAKSFTCTFHGWNYSIDGKLANVPHGDAIYDPKDLSDANCRRVRLHNYKGFIFGTWDHEAPDFLSYLGDFAWYLDAYLDRYEGGFEVVAFHKWVVPGNWKFNAEQPASDAYHAASSHISAIEARLAQAPQGEPQTKEALKRMEMLAAPVGNQVGSPYGHGAGWFTKGAPINHPVVNAWDESMIPHVSARIGAERVNLMAHANVFPTFMLLNNFSFRITLPRGPDKMEIWAWTMVPKCAPDEVKDVMRREVVHTFSPAGMFEQDDALNWEEEQHVLRGAMARRTPLIYRQRLGQARWDADGLPGKTAGHVFAEEGARMLYQHWLDLMSGESWDSMAAKKQAREHLERQRQQATNTQGALA